MSQPATVRAMPDPTAVEQQNQLFDLYNDWPGDEDPDDDPEFVAQAREIMGLPPLEGDEPVAQIDALVPLARKRAVNLVREAAVFDRERLHHYWTRDPEGLAKWVGHLHEWTALRDHLIKFVGPERADRMASEWFHEVKGFWPGSDLHRVEHGKPPRGHRIGPG